jgi:serine/threonine protein kinase
MRILRKVSHPNVVQMYGLSNDAKRGLLLVTEFMEGGSLLDYLKRVGNSLKPISTIRICLEICCGMVIQQL